MAAKRSSSPDTLVASGEAEGTQLSAAEILDARRTAHLEELDFIQYAQGLVRQEAPLGNYFASILEQGPAEPGTIAERDARYVEAVVRKYRGDKVSFAIAREQGELSRHIRHVAVESGAMIPPSLAEESLSERASEVLSQAGAAAVSRETREGLVAALDAEIQSELDVPPF
ncbi:MAG: hypothetical protein M3N59_02860 [bacterium]|nr:hypothetical protein [bacterium]